LLLLGLGVPLALPVVELAGHPQAWSAWEEAGRILRQLQTTALLVAGTLLVAVPAGIAGAVLLYRTDLPLRQCFRFLTVLTLFVPLPLFAAAWQATLGAGGWLAGLIPLPFESRLTESGPGWQPWVQGLGAAIWVHAMAGLPWVVLLVGQGLSWVERELEEDALQAASGWRVFLAVTLPRSRAAIAAAALIVAVQTATDISVTDLMDVRTFAEAVYLEFAEQGLAVLPRAVAVCLPQVVLTVLLVVYVAGRWERTLPPREQLAAPLCLFPLGRMRWPVTGLLAGLIGLFIAVPVLALVWKAGLGGSPEVWSAGRAVHQVSSVIQGKGLLVVENLVLAAAAGTVAASLALVCCWLAVEARWFRVIVLVLMATALAMPGPLVGMGLKETILHLVSIEEALGLGEIGPLRIGLYEGPSLLPVLWVCVIRFFPYAVAVLWPAVRMLPLELRESARLDGARPIDELLRITWPLTRTICLCAALAVVVLSLGELSAGKLVAPPGSTTLAHVIFEQMHRGVPADVAGLCLVLLLAVALAGSLLAMTRKRPAP
jgi:iron(III) transport system permease protein